MSWQLARRAERLNPSTIREILKTTERPGIISLAGGLPSADTFPVQAMRDASAAVLRDGAREALQYAASEGFAPLREWVAAEMATHGVACDAAQVLITTGSQQGLDLVGKVLIDPGSAGAVESPTYLGALPDFAPCEPEFVAVEGDADGPLPDEFQRARGARFLYLLPIYQNPTGRCLPAHRRLALVDRARYKAQRDAMQAAPLEHLGDFPGCSWQPPAGGMFFWLELPRHIDASALLPRAVDAGMAYVPGNTFYPHGGHAHTLRLSFVTVAPELITRGVAALAAVLKSA